MVNAVAMMGSGTAKAVGKELRLKGTDIFPIAAMDSDYAGLLAAGKLVLMGIPAVLPRWEGEPDDWSIPQWKEVRNRLNKYLIFEVEEVLKVAKAVDEEKLYQSLNKFWRKLNG